MKIATKLMQIISFPLLIAVSNSITYAASQPTFGQACQTYGLNTEDKAKLAPFMTCSETIKKDNEEVQKICKRIKDAYHKRALTCHQDKINDLNNDQQTEKREEFRWIDSCYKLLMEGIAPTEKTKAPNFADKLKNTPDAANQDIKDDNDSAHRAKQFDRKLLIRTYGSNYIKTGLKIGLPVATIGYLFSKYREYKKALLELNKEIAQYETKVKNGSYPEATKQEFFKKIKEYEIKQKAALKNIFKPQTFAKAALWAGAVGCLFAYKIIHEAHKEFDEDKNLAINLLPPENIDKPRGAPNKNDDIDV